ncbi:MAG: DNA mismatch repair endonuclease MutL [Saprospiraceae bacterium]|jgi:DNA mismatch repair protein MutL|nr:DNA mismatch repair endonuclease MutL [Saprospiraceae bacterium]
MADIIQLLPDSIANQIAAGEVIQRPASVVKELMENAIDADSTSIKLIIKDAGKSLVQVIDNGKGMSVTDARMCFERHATSKIRKSEDLFHIKSMGFRGEAMASIAAVAQVELKTRRKEDELGIRIVIEGSEIKVEEPCQCAVGTSISVKNLFYNVPARRKFLKSDIVELRHIHDEFQHIALAFPQIFFSLFHDQTEMYHLPESNIRQRIVNMFGSNFNARLVPINEETEALTIVGFIGKPDYAKRSKGEQYLFVNGRYIRSPYLNHAITSGYEKLLPEDSYPFYTIFLEIDPSQIDINVHPTKQEIKFENEKLVYNYLFVAVKHALGKHSITPMLDFEQEESFSTYQMPHTFKKQTDEVSNPGSTFKKAVDPNLKSWESLYKMPSDFVDATIDTSAASFTIETEWLGHENQEKLQIDDSNLKKVPYQIHNTYIINQIKSGFLVIDQQAASEQILYERFLTSLEENQGQAVQKLLFPQTINLTTGDFTIAVQILPNLNKLGFDIQEFGKNTLVVHGMPAEMDASSNPEKMIEEFIEQIKEGYDLKTEVSENLAKVLSRQMSIKKGKLLNSETMKELIDSLFACKMPFQSPSGRKCFITFELDELDKMFF